MFVLSVFQFVLLQYDSNIDNVPLDLFLWRGKIPMTFSTSKRTLNYILILNVLLADYLNVVNCQQDNYLMRNKEPLDKKQKSIWMHSSEVKHHVLKSASPLLLVITNEFNINTKNILNVTAF